ncbi:MAG: hypothetical protein FJX34_02400, partial [Alphaproteobacteria bacterium]|nr:hypothetical protein [Alphaproteobacteria bacterium]
MSVRNQPRQNFVKYLLFFAAFLLLFSCTDSGCIDADDFGEYESQTLTVTSNSSQDNCAYNAALAITDSGQGSGIKPCLVTNSNTIIDEINTTYYATGCVNFYSNAGKTTAVTDYSTIAKLQNLCSDNCVQACLTNVGSANSAGAEPAWMSTSRKITGQNSGVTIRPGSQIMVTAAGNVSLGSALTYPPLFVQANNPLPQSLTNSWSQNFFDFNSGQAANLGFSGAATVNGTSISTASASSSNLYNMARRLVIYTIAHPTNYGGFDLTQNTERAGSKVTPLLPDPAAWQCTYNTGSSNTLQMSCGNSSYVNIGYNYTGFSDTLTSSTFPISSALQSSGLTQYGGVVRYDGDGLNGTTKPDGTDYDPFSAVTCNGSTGTCVGIDNVAGDQGVRVGDLSSGDVTITNTYTNSYQVSLKSLTGDTGCNIALTYIKVRDSSSNILYAFQPTDGISVASSYQSNFPIISLEPNQTLVISQNSVKYNGTGVNCGRVIGARFLRYYDLTMQQSGFVRFTMLGGASGYSSSACVIKGRIINPTGSHVDFNGAGSADFYEYDNFYNFSNNTNITSSNDPLDGISPTISQNNPISGILNWTPGYTVSSTNPQIFVRKGQKIRFDPRSWDGTWTINSTNNTTRQCGIGMMMMIDPRPALLCRGSTSDLVSNPACTADINGSGVLTGCQAPARECSDSNNTTYYCPYTDCLDTYTCTAGDSTNNYTKTGCNPSIHTLSAITGQTAITRANCTSLYNSFSNDTDRDTAAAKCNACNNKQYINVTTAAYITQSNMVQCYDLENYTGKVDNIPINPASITDVNSFLTGSNAKGAVKLSGFNGIYGNFASFS